MPSTQEERQKALNLISGILQEYKLTLTVAIQDQPDTTTASEASNSPSEAVSEAEVVKDA